MEDLIRMLTCPCRDGAGKVSCRCHELAPKFRCGCASCISQRLARLMALLYGHLMAGMGAYPVLSKPSKADVQKALRPMRAFMTRRGRAAGMTWDG